MSSGEHEEKNIEFLFEEWKLQQKQLLQDLVRLSEQPSEASPDSLRCMVQSVLQLHEDYYKMKSSCADRNTLLVLNPTWTSSLEKAYLWIGGWRPTSAVALLYSKAGLQLEAKLTQMFNGIAVNSPDLGDLSQRQIDGAGQLHGKVSAEEDELTRKHAMQQEQAAGPDIVILSHLVGEENTRERVRSTLTPKEEELRKILVMADDLRLRTLKSVVEIMSPVQVLHFMIAATELQLRLHTYMTGEWQRMEGSQTRLSWDPSFEFSDFLQSFSSLLS